MLVQDGTDIDRRQCKRIVPMKVLVLGLCRTGTMCKSMSKKVARHGTQQCSGTTFQHQHKATTNTSHAAVRTALRSLGYLETYHMRAASTETPRDNEFWMRAIKAKWDGEGTFEKEDWDQLLGHCQAVCDLPAAAFAAELIAAYPDAKVILTNRDPDSWHRSTTKTIYQGIRDPTFQLLSHFDWAFQLYRPMLLTLWDRMFQGDFENKGREVFAAHYDLVRELVPKERLLEYEAADGWGPLVKFLGESMPEEPFPFTNSASDFQRGIRGRNNTKLRNHVVKGLVYVLGAACCYMAIHWFLQMTSMSA